ncbi:MAG: hypothetical protein AABY22_11740 [Nanoarchaeota archaeon]
MSRPIIIEKLERLLSTQPLTKESEIVYLMVEIRKVLDHVYYKKDFKLLRFYCDWIVHTTKKRNLENIEPIISSMYQTIKTEIENPHSILIGKSPVADFVYLEELKKEMIDFFTKESLPFHWCELKEKWVEFVKLLVNVLIDQPIINPTKDVSSFTFLESVPGCIRGRIDFTGTISNKDGNYDHYKFGNVY